MMGTVEFRSEFRPVDEIDSNEFRGMRRVGRLGRRKPRATTVVPVSVVASASGSVGGQCPTFAGKIRVTDAILG